MKFKTYFAVSLLVSVVDTLGAFAGTGQIFSPAGLPQSSTQTYTPPTPGNVPTVAFPTPPLPLGEGVLQGFSGTSLPLDSSSPSSGIATDGSALKQPAASSSSTGSIESFFQCNQSVASQNTQTKKQKGSHLGKALWHVLDNLGVPMVLSKDGDLDPSLRHPASMPLDSVGQTTGLSPTLRPDPPQKIPARELEGY